LYEHVLNESVKCDICCAVIDWLHRCTSGTVAATK